MSSTFYGISNYSDGTAAPNLPKSCAKSLILRQNCTQQHQLWKNFQSIITSVDYKPKKGIGKDSANVRVMNNALKKAFC
jgi:hypothetical protein